MWPVTACISAPTTPPWRRTSTPVIALPAIAVSVLTLATPVTDVGIRQPTIFNTLFCAGWHDVEHMRIDGEVMVSSAVTAGKSRVAAEALTYVVDLLALRGKDPIRTLVVEPLLRLYGGRDHGLATLGPAVMRLALTPDEEEAVQGPVAVPEPEV